jgi:hypothetical protein
MMLRDAIGTSLRRVLLWAFVLFAAAPLLPAQTTGSVTVTNGASYAAGYLAPASIASAFGQNLAASLVSAPSSVLPLTLGGVSVDVVDSSGADLQAPLYFVSPGQVNFLVPDGSASGPATVRVTAFDGTIYQGSVVVQDTVPGLFTASANGEGTAAGMLDLYGGPARLFLQLPCSHGTLQPRQSSRTRSAWARPPTRPFSCFTAPASG